ncbi:MDR family MFS transporter [Paenibacillus sp. GD4]|uniref:MDR family MFS transporter n=1 Tax=Paenibacillus sp. GD4 TaxID=3068890 RepID=UPI0027968FC6|nr:MDR family MFS transporter [Paenibacillus sp. GD4]MDQ1911008.1 MDR family MFS transporter [Paenibacillus sp. GD4]
MAGKESKLGLVVAGLLLGIFIAAIDNTIVATAMGTIVGELGGLEQFVWVTSAYLVAEMAGMPIFGKLSDMYGRKRFFVFGLATFMVGSMLCGTADSIVQLSIYRAIQGIGGGALMPISFAIMFDAIPPEKRGKMGGLFGATFGLSSIFGPLLGAYITDYIGWRWIFYINVPLSVVALALVVFYYHESKRHARQIIDWSGAITLVGAVICLMFGLELAGSEYAWGSPQIISLFAGFAVLFAAFLYVETKALEPIVSFRMFGYRLFAASNLVGLFSGAAFITASIYIPIHIQGVLGGSATNSGLILLPMMLSSVVAATTGGILMNKLSYRRIMLVFTAVFVVGMALLSTITAETSRWLITIYMIITGLGIGASFSVLSNAVIHHFDETQRGSASSTFSFLRSLGMTLGISVFGILQREELTARLAEAFAGQGAAPAGLADPRKLLQPEERLKLPEPVLDLIKDALAGSIAYTFLWATLPAVLSLAFVLLMSKEKLLLPVPKDEDVSGTIRPAKVR